MKRVLVRGEGAVGVAALHRLRAEGVEVRVEAPTGDYLHEVAGALGVLAVEGEAFDEVLVAEGPWPAG